MVSKCVWVVPLLWYNGIPRASTVDSWYNPCTLAQLLHCLQFTFNTVNFQFQEKLILQ
jgi:hypothetical protein